MRYFRDSSQDHLRMLFQEEFFVYLSFYVVPFLRSIVFRGESKSFHSFFFFFDSPINTARIDLYMFLLFFFLLSFDVRLLFVSGGSH